MANEERSREDSPRRGSPGIIIIGLILVSLGVLLLIDNLAPELGFARLWPVIIIVWGFATIISGFIPPFDLSRLFNGAFIGTVGMILLSNTLGITPFSFWLDLIALWPVLLIAAGVAIFGSVTRNKIIAALPPVILLLTLILAAVYSDVLFQERGLTDFKLSQDVATGITSGTASIDFAVGDINVGATDMLYDIDAREPVGREPQLSFSRSDSSVALRVRPQSNARSLVGNRERDWTVLLSRDIDWQLNFNAGVSDSELDLSDLEVSRLNLGGGVSNTEVRFGDRVEQVSATIDAGVSRLKLLVPKSTGVRLEINRGLSTSDFQNIDLQRVGGDNRIIYETPGFNNAARRLILNVDIGVSSFVVEGY